MPGSRIVPRPTVRQLSSMEQIELIRHAVRTLEALAVPYATALAHEAFPELVEPVASAVGLACR